ncbi:MAG: hypothetical protein ACRDSH_05225, partial [Pseudonocardiaceae bacterium]
MTISVVVRVAPEVSPEAVDQLMDDLRALGFDPTCRAVAVRRGAGEVISFVLLVLPVKVFFDAFTTRFADDAYSKLKALVGKVLRRRGEPEDHD